MTLPLPVGGQRRRSLSLGLAHGASANGGSSELFHLEGANGFFVDVTKKASAGDVIGRHLNEHMHTFFGRSMSASAGVLPHNYIEVLTKSKAEKKKGQGGSFWGDDKPEEAEVEVVAVVAPAEQKQEGPGEQQQEQQQQEGGGGSDSEDDAPLASLAQRKREEERRRKAEAKSTGRQQQANGQCRSGEAK